MKNSKEDCTVIDVDYFKGQILVINKNHEEFTGNNKFTYWKKLNNGYTKYKKATGAYFKEMIDYEDLVRRCKML